MYFCPVDFLHEKIFDLNSLENFELLAMQIFCQQAIHCAPYSAYLSALNVDINAVKHSTAIPFLPIEFFKTKKIVSNNNLAEIVFTSSGTTGMSQSKHYVTDVKLYEKSYLKAFQSFYGNIKDFCILALLPSYQERAGSSLIYMVDDLIAQSCHPDSGYFLNDDEALASVLAKQKQLNRKTILIGVTYALLDFIEKFEVDFPELIVMETGGMKGRRREMVREELHQTLTSGFGIKKIHSEYGMTELLSQAYSLGDGIFSCPPWMKVLIRDVNDPFSTVVNGKTGGINVIDLANLTSCSFIATQDLGRLDAQGNFEVLGRFDNSDIRGCNLLVQ